MVDGDACGTYVIRTICDMDLGTWNQRSTFTAKSCLIGCGTMVEVVTNHMAQQQIDPRFFRNFAIVLSIVEFDNHDGAIRRALSSRRSVQQASLPSSIPW